jgi:inosine/xanthosine triphosphate pyrophosphatase family protein
MKKYLLKTALWVLNRYGFKYVVIPESIYAIKDDVNIIVEKVRNTPGLRSNEYRHSHAYATLKKKLPTAKSRDIGLCIELVIYGLI